MLSRLSRASRASSAAVARAFARVAPLSTQATASAAGAPEFASSFGAQASAELQADLDRMAAPPAPEQIPADNRWLGAVYGPDMQPLTEFPSGYNPEFEAYGTSKSSELVPTWAAQLLVTPNPGAESPASRLVPVVPAVDRRPSRFVASKYSYKHTFTLVELTHHDFLKKLVLLESKLADKFGSTAVLRVVKRGRPISKRWAILRSPFVHKRAQDHLEYRAHEYQLQVAYTFELADQELNRYVQDTLKTVLRSIGSVTQFGYHIHRRSNEEGKYHAHSLARRREAAEVRGAKLAATAADSVNVAMQHQALSKNTFYAYSAPTAGAGAAGEAAAEAEVEGADVVVGGGGVYGSDADAGAGAQGEGVTGAGVGVGVGFEEEGEETEMMMTKRQARPHFRGYHA